MWLMAPPFRQSVSVGRAPQWLRHNGYQVLRFWNNDVIENIDGVLETIAGALREVSPPDEESRVWHGSSSPSPRLPSGRLRPSSTGYGEGRGEGDSPRPRIRGDAKAAVKYSGPAPRREQ